MPSKLTLMEESLLRFLLETTMCWP